MIILNIGLEKILAPRQISLMQIIYRRVLLVEFSLKKILKRHIAKLNIEAILEMKMEMSYLKHYHQIFSMNIVNFMNGLMILLFMTLRQEIYLMQKLSQLTILKLKICLMMKLET